MSNLFNYMSRSNLSLNFSTATQRAGTIRGTTQLLTDGDMEAVGVGAWTDIGIGAPTIEKVTVSPKVGIRNLKVTNVGAAACGVFQVALTVGKRYRVRGWARGDGVATVPRVFFQGTQLIWLGTSSTWEYFDVVAVAGAGELQVRLYSLGVDGGYAEWDDIEVFEVDELLSDSDMEETGVGAWQALLSAVLTKETTDPWSGIQNLRITHGGVNNPAARQINMFTVGRTYRITGRFRGDGTFTPSVREGATTIIAGTPSTTWQEFDIIYTITVSTDLRLYSNANLAGYSEFDNVSVRPILHRTLDVSSQGHVCLLGDGFTAASFPAWQGNKSFLLDGGDDYLKVVQASGIFGTAEQTIVCAIRPGFTLGAERFFFDSTAGAGRCAARKIAADTINIVLGNVSLGLIAQATWEPHWRENGLNVFIISGTSGATDIYLNGVLLITYAGAWTPGDVDEIFLGVENDALGGNFLGEYHGFYTFPFKLSSLQIADISIQLGINP